MNERWEKYLALRQARPEFFGNCHAMNDISPKKAEEMKLGVDEEHTKWVWVREWDGITQTERPVYLDEELEQRTEGYFVLAARRPDLFINTPQIPLCMDRREMLRFIEKTGQPLGLVFDNGKFYKVVADLIAAPQPYRYARVIYPDAKGNGTVIIPRLKREGQEPLFGILHLFRHAIRAVSGGEFPRGFQKPGISPEQNAAEELQEEFNISREQLSSLTLLGSTQADTGLCSGQAQIYLADITYPLPVAKIGFEGIIQSEWIPQSELLARLRARKILDGFTQSAVLFYLLMTQD